MFRVIWVTILLIYLIYIYVLIFGNKEKKHPIYWGKFSVIIPCYNENPRYLESCINSIMFALGNKKVILVDDGSTNKATIKKIIELKNKFSELVVLRQKTNRGKRRAHALGLTQAGGDVIIFVDSDTIVKFDSFIELLRPFNDEEVGASSGNILLANKNKNFLTKSINTMYWCAFNIYRKGMGKVGYMHVCPGALSAYRKNLLEKLLPEYINQTFMLDKCNISDDRFLTIRMQTRFNKKVAFQSSSLAHTYTPENVKGFFKQLIRWRRGMMRESFLLLKEPNKGKNILLVLDTWFNLLTPYVVLVFKVIFVWLTIHFAVTSQINNLLFLWISLVIWLVIFSTTYSLYMFSFKEGRKIFGWRIIYSFLYESIFFFSVIPATLTLHKQGGWITR